MPKNTSRITVPNDPVYIDGVLSYCAVMARRTGFSEKETAEITTALKEACANVLTHALDPYEDESYSVTFEVREDGLKILIDEMGLPFSSRLIKEGKVTPGLKAIEDNMDSVEYINRGREGKELQLFKYLKGRHVEEYFPAEELRPYEYCEVVPGDAKFTVRLMDAAEAVEVSKCIYRAYKYTYLKEDLYFPERIEAMNREGRMISAVASTEKGEVIGHFALLPRPNGRVAEIGAAVVEPKFRGRGIMKSMLNFLMEMAGRRGFAALYGNAFTMHVLSQRTNLKFGFAETALQLGCFPPGSVKMLRDRSFKGAGSVMTFFKYLKGPDKKNVFLPPRHRSMLERIYAGIGVERSFEAPYFIPTETMAEESTIQLSLKPSHRTAVVEVKDYGMDIGKRMRAKLVELENKGFGAIYLDLDLKNPFTTEASIMAEDLGFFFSGLLPDYSEGDVLRLQYYNTVMEYDEIEAYSPFAAELKDYVRGLDPKWRALNP